MVLLIVLRRLFFCSQSGSDFESADEILNCNHSNDKNVEEYNLGCTYGLNVCYSVLIISYNVIKDTECLVVLFNTLYQVIYRLAY